MGPVICLIHIMWQHWSTDCSACWPMPSIARRFRRAVWHSHGISPGSSRRSGLSKSSTRCNADTTKHLYHDRPMVCALLAKKYTEELVGMRSIPARDILGALDAACRHDDRHT